MIRKSKFWVTDSRIAHQAQTSLVKRQTSLLEEHVWWPTGIISQYFTFFNSSFDGAFLNNNVRAYNILVRRPMFLTVAYFKLDYRHLYAILTIKDRLGRSVGIRCNLVNEVYNLSNVGLGITNMSLNMFRGICCSWSWVLCYTYLVMLF